ncbi:unnamed protein product [Diamesa tonsa]
MINIEKFVLPSAVQNNPIIKIHLLGMKVFGYMIFDEQLFKRLHCFRGVFFSISFIAFNLTQFIDLFSKFGDINEMTKNASTTLLFTTTTFRMIHFYLHRMRFVNLVKVMNDGVVKIQKYGNKYSKDMLEMKVKYTRNLTIVFWVFALITAMTMCINSFIQSFYYQPQTVFDDIKQMNITTFPPVILRSWFPFEDQWKHFYWVYFIQYYIMSIGMLIVPCWHSFIVAIMIYAIVSLKCSNHSLQNMVETVVEDDKRHNEQLIECIESHKQIVAFVKELSSLISLGLFVDFIIFSILLCALLFQASQVEIGVQFTINVFYILTMTTILWMYYWHANEINYYSNLLSVSAYMCPWHTFTVRFNKQLLIFMVAAKPIKMYAGFIDMKLDTFIAILRASYSYFTLLTQVAK